MPSPEEPDAYGGVEEPTGPESKGGTTTGNGYVPPPPDQWFMMQLKACETQTILAGQANSVMIILESGNGEVIVNHGHRFPLHQELPWVGSGIVEVHGMDPHGCIIHYRYLY